VPPLAVRKALAEAAMDPDNWKYALRDTDELLEAVCAYYARRFGVVITPDQVASCYGSQEGIGHIGLVLCDEGDTVLLPSPCYPVFIAGAMMAGAEPWYYPMTAETGFLPRVSDIPEEVARRAKYMVVSLPSNPMGSVGTPEVYREIIDFAKHWDILILHDNAYSDILYDGLEGGSFLSYEGAAEVGCEFFSLSKSFNLTGARISFLIGRRDVVAAFRKLRSQIDFGMFIPIQKAAIAALSGPQEAVEATSPVVCIPLKQHIGAPAEACVAVGSTVQRGDVIGRMADGALGADVHASICGRVERVEGGMVVIRAE
jgi:LL-diaminopimelate aminotransferase